jgi:hypothetical protein
MWGLCKDKSPECTRGCYPLPSEPGAFQLDALTIGSDHAGQDPTEEATQGDGAVLPRPRNSSRRLSQRFGLTRLDLLEELFSDCPISGVTPPLGSETRHPRRGAPVDSA